MTALQQRPGSVKAVRLFCQSWDCKRCAPKRRKRLMHEAAKGRPNRLITLTARPEEFAHPDIAARALSLGWRRCREALKRDHGHEAVDALCVFEEHKSGWPHLHILCRSNFISQKWLSKYFGRRLGSPIVDIRKVKNAKQAIAYVAKYVVKQPKRFRGTKRYWRTAGYIPKREPKPAPEYPWQVVFTSIESIMYAWGEAASPNFTHPEDVVVRSTGPPA